jgi:hypothetical protein
MTSTLSLRVFRPAKHADQICFEVVNPSELRFPATCLRVMFGPVYVLVNPALKALPATSKVQFLSNGEAQAEIDLLVAKTPPEEYSIELFNDGELVQRWAGTLLFNLYDPLMPS